MRARIQIPIPDLEIATEVEHTWTVENWRSLSKKERGPKFECGGHPWSVPPTILCHRDAFDGLIGEYCFSPLETMSIMHRYILSKATRKMRKLPKAGMLVCNSHL